MLIDFGDPSAIQFPHIWAISFGLFSVHLLGALLDIFFVHLVAQISFGLFSGHLLGALFDNLLYSFNNILYVLVIFGTF